MYRKNNKLIFEVIFFCPNRVLQYRHPSELQLPLWCGHKVYWIWKIRIIFPVSLQRLSRNCSAPTNRKYGIYFTARYLAQRGKSKKYGVQYCMFRLQINKIIKIKCCSYRRNISMLQHWNIRLHSLRCLQHSNYSRCYNTFQARAEKSLKVKVR